MTRTIPILVMLLIVGCTTLTKKLDLERQEGRLPVASFPITCERGQSGPAPALVGPGTESQQAFRDFLNAHPRLTFEEQAVLWALFQMKVRPDFTSPVSRLQFLSRTSQGTRYWDFAARGADEQSFFHGLGSFLKGHKILRPLSHYARLLDQANMTGKLVVERGLEDHLSGMAAAIGADPLLRRHWYRGDELLRTGERLPTVALAPLVRAWEARPSTPVTAPPLFSYRRTPRLDARCNYDLTLYDNSIFLIDKEENRGHLFGITAGDKSFLAVASQSLAAPVAFGDSPLLRGGPQVRSTAFCVIQRPEGEVWLTANQSRDPGQHVYHLFRYGLGSVADAAGLERLLRHARHMFLSDPLRLVIESGRSREDQIRELLKLNVPIYNAAHIGNIWAWSDFPGDGPRFYIDDRNPGALLCPR